MPIRLHEQDGGTGHGGRRRLAPSSLFVGGLVLLVVCVILGLGLSFKDEVVGEATLLGIPVVGSSQSGGNPFSDVPASHWSYGRVAELQGAGLFTGYPDGTFDGHRLITRYEFAVAIERLRADAQRTSPTNGLSRREACRRIAVLCREFAPELNMLGADAGSMCRDLNQISFPGRRPQPPSQAVPVNFGHYSPGPQPVVDRDGRPLGGTPSG